MAELLLVIACAATTFTFIANDLPWLGLSIFVTVVALRTSLVDFTLVGSFATFTTMVFGFFSICRLIIWSVSW